MRVVGAPHGTDYRYGMPFAQVGSMSRSGAVPTVAYARIASVTLD
jgi:hypothetical protein